MKKNLLLALAIILSLVIAFPVVADEKQQDEHVWVLVDVIDYDNADSWAISNESEYYQNDYSCSQGHMSVKTTYIGKTEEWRNIKHGEGVRITASFSKPPERIYPDEEVNISITVSASENTLSSFNFGGSASVDFDKPDINPGFRDRNAILFINVDGEHNFGMDSNTNYETINETLTAKLSKGREEGQQIALRQNFYMGISMATYYVYEWRSADHKPIKSLPPTFPNDGESVPFQGDPGMKRSGVGISDLYGEVLVELYDDDGNFIDAYTPALGEELAVNAVIKTGYDSGVQLSLRDMTTFAMKSNTSVKIGDQSENESKLSILAGHVWGNVKQMLKDGSMDIEMSQAVCGIKGTTFILEEDGQISTIKVFEGTVEVRPLNGDKSAKIKGGDSVFATSKGLSDIQAFDTDGELSNWNPEIQTMTTEAIKNSQSAGSTGALTVLLVIVGLLIITIVVITARKQSAAKSKKTQEYGQQATDNHIAKRYCAHCGQAIFRDNKFCTRCGKPLL